MKYSKEEMIEIIKDCISIADVCRKCGWQPRGDNYKVVHRYIKEYNLDVSHFTGKASNINNRFNKHNVKPLNEILVKDSYYSTNTLKLRLFKEGIKPYKCEKCGISEWNGEEISLQLHHINGDNTDNRLENLQVLCPNCHSQTDSYCGSKNMRNKHRYYCNSCGKKIEKTKTGLCSDCYKKMINDNSDVVLKSHRIHTVIGHCSDCGKELYFKNDNGLCMKCYKQHNSKFRVDKETLEKLIYEKSFCEIGRMYGVSDNAIRKLCKKYNLPFRKKDIK